MQSVGQTWVFYWYNKSNKIMSSTTFLEIFGIMTRQYFGIYFRHKFKKSYHVEIKHIMEGMKRFQ